MSTPLDFRPLLDAGLHKIAGCPAGTDAMLLAEMAQRTGRRGIIYVVSDDEAAARIIEQLAFYAPELPVFYLPAWDCLPYDRVSPSAPIVAERLACLQALLNPPKAAHIIITTAAAILQRLPPQSSIAAVKMQLRVGDVVQQLDLAHFLNSHGYHRTDIVREAGEYAYRGSIIDIFPQGADMPCRLDLFGDSIESIKQFDVKTQLSAGPVTELLLQPMAEFSLTPEKISIFRSGYREAFGAVTDNDALYAAISEGRLYAGMEHWLPLFYPAMATLFDYLPYAAVMLAPNTPDALKARHTQIDDFFQARQSLQKAGKKSGQPQYKALPPKLLYLDEAEWHTALAARICWQLSAFAPLDNEPDFGLRTVVGFAQARAEAENLYATVTTEIRQAQQNGQQVLIAAYSHGSASRLGELLREQGGLALEPVTSFAAVLAQDSRIASLAILPQEQGFASPQLRVITESDILGDRLSRPRSRKKRADNFLSESSSLNEGDLVVHLEHGVGRYEGLITLQVGGLAHDCLRLTYAGGDRLFVPVENIEVLSRYGGEAASATLDKLGGTAWQARKARVKQRLRDLTAQLLKLAAARALREGQRVEIDSGLYQQFAARFPYAETEDQAKAIDDVLADLASGRPMDRLVCGDVGFGKTEVALRAAFAAVEAGLQVAVVVPTTLLARQHTRSFSARFAGLPVRVAQLSRFVNAKDSKQIKAELAAGQVDIVVGTHALLGKDVAFKNLGLLIIDEEQHFGVKQKEKLKEFKSNVHILTLSATPIPRTLQLALSGLRELSLITTPPIDRLAVKTFVLPFDPLVLREALMREHFRGGQSFFVVPRLEDLPEIQERLRELVPELKFTVAHGQLSPTALEEVMAAFDDGQYDILLATNIIESGLDLPRANTMIIYRADMFGLAQLYQLRGRVGRAKQRGFAYLTWPAAQKLSQSAEQRLQVMQTLEHLGAGFQLASHDMDLRGAGNLLGEEQSGQIREVGVELYQQMLQEAVEQAQAGGMVADEDWSPQINLGLAVLIPENYVTDLGVRLSLYRRLGTFTDSAELEAFAAELIDRFGDLPAEVDNLLQVMAIKLLCKQAGIEKVEAGPKGAVIAFKGNRFARPDLLLAYIQSKAGILAVRPDQKLVALKNWDEMSARKRGLQKLLAELVALAKGQTLAA